MTEKNPKTTEPTSDKGKLKKVTKKSLRTMQKTRKYHPVREQARIAKYGTSGFARNIWLSSAATAVMAITLIILFVTIVASVILTNTAQMMKDKIDITIYLKPTTTSEVLDQLETKMWEDSNTKEVVTATPEEEYKKFLEENADSEDIIGILDDEMTAMMIKKMQATMRVKVHNVDNLDSIKELVATDSLFKTYIDSEKAPTYDVNQAEIATITSWARIARTGGIILALVFLVVSVLIIFSTIRMAIFSRREEIYMMKLVGADKRFIRGPFLVEAEICGIIAGIIAATASCLGFRALAPKLVNYGIDVDSIINVLGSNQIILVFLAFIIAGVLVGRVSARMAVQKYLKKM